MGNPYGTGGYYSPASISSMPTPQQTGSPRQSTPFGAGALSQQQFRPMDAAPQAAPKVQLNPTDQFMYNKSPIAKDTAAQQYGQKASDVMGLGTSMWQTPSIGPSGNIQYDDVYLKPTIDYEKLKKMTEGTDFTGQQKAFQEAFNTYQQMKNMWEDSYKSQVQSSLNDYMSGPSVDPWSLSAQEQQAISAAQAPLMAQAEQSVYGVGDWLENAYRNMFNKYAATGQFGLV